MQKKRNNKTRLFIIITICSPVIIFYLCILAWSYFVVRFKPLNIYIFLTYEEVFLGKKRIFQAVNNYFQLLR